MTKELTVTNLYGVRGTVTHRTDANILVVTGDNGAGKSSFVEAFAHIFCHKAMKGAPDPVHTGEDAAEATFTDDDGTAFTRKWRGGKMAALEIRAHDGAKYAQASDLLAKELGAVTVDVSSFLAVDEKVRRDAILAKSKLPEGVDFAALNQGVAAAESARTDANREAKRLDAAWRSLASPGAGVPDVEVSASDLVERIRVADEQKAAKARAVQVVEHWGGEVARLREQLAVAEVTLEAERTRLDDLADGEDTAALREQLAEVEETNRAVRARCQFYDAKAAAIEAHVIADRAENDVKAARQAKADALKAAEFPHPALSVDDDYVLVDGVAWPYVNSAEKSLVALAVAIHDAPADGLRIVILKEGDWLDANTLARANEMLTERGFFALVDRGRPDLPDTAGIDVLELVDGQAA
jgi:hypothetical protein